jgi:hypothetical protein
VHQRLHTAIAQLAAAADQYLFSGGSQEKGETFFLNHKLYLLYQGVSHGTNPNICFYYKRILSRNQGKPLAKT